MTLDPYSTIVQTLITEKIERPRKGLIIPTFIFTYSFTDLRGLQLLLVQKFQAIEVLKILEIYLKYM